MSKYLVLFLMIPLFLAAPLHAVSYPLSTEGPSYLNDEDVMRVGAKVHLFHSGTEDVKNAIKAGDVLTVYREYPPDLSGISSISGKVKVIGTLGGYYFVGEVIEGSVVSGNLALKGAVACLVTTRLKPRH